jgi:hypothetical protein
MQPRAVSEVCALSYRLTVSTEMKLTSSHNAEDQQFKLMMVEPLLDSFNHEKENLSKHLHDSKCRTRKETRYRISH